MIRALSSSLSLRLLGIFIITSALLIAILVGLFTRGLSGQWTRSIRPHLVQYIQYVQQDLGSPPDPARAESLALRLPVDIHIYKQGQLFYATTSRRLDVDTIQFDVVGRHFRAHARTGAAVRQQQDQSILQTLPAIARHDGPGRILRVTDGDFTIYYDLREAGPRRGGRDRFNNELFLALSALAIVLAASYLLIRRQLSPIRQIQKSVGVMSEGNLGHRIDRNGHSDLDKLALSIDAMAERLQAILDAKRQLLIALSHELRSPITRARINTELLPESRTRERLLEDLSDMERMIRDIMESEQLQGQHSVLNRELLDAASLFGSELKRVAPDAQLHLDPSESVMMVDGDAARLRILLRNLVLNALQHGRNNDGSVSLQVGLSAVDNHLVLKVADEGCGIAPEHLNDVADPFYRPDASRSRETGGFGLGLTLARLIAEAHGGSLQIDSDPATQSGTRVCVLLPLAVP